MNATIARQMFSAEVLKLRRNRPVMAFAGLLTVGVVAIALGYQTIQHASNPQLNGPAGGLDGFSHAVRFLGVFFGALAASLIGTEAGTADIGSGVFRDLVATGRSRLWLYVVRVPAAFVVTFAFTLTAYLIALIVSYVAAGGTPTPTASMAIDSVLWIALCNFVFCGFAVGVGSLTGSRGATLTATIGWTTVATQLLLHLTSLGTVRNVLLTAALGNVMPVPGDIAGIFMATVTAVIVIVCWGIVPSVVGAWQTVRRDA
jgi:hypothetical protein